MLDFVRASARGVPAVAILVVGVLGVTLSMSVAPAQANDATWQPHEPPLSTPWTYQVGPDNALPEYPRPQMTREQWQNLNGL